MAALECRGKEMDKKDSSSDFMFLFFARNKNTALNKEVIFSVEFSLYRYKAPGRTWAFLEHHF